MNNTHKHGQNKITNSIRGLETGKIRNRLVYAYYLIIGLFFFVIGLFTAFNVFSVWFRYGGLDEARAFRSALFLCYIFLNFMIAYGFIFCRKWLVAVFGFNFLALLVTYIMSLDFSRVAIFGASELTSNRQFASILISGFIFLTIYLSRRHLQGIFWRKLVVLSFAFVLLLSLFITKTNLVY